MGVIFGYGGLSLLNLFSAGANSTRVFGESAAVTSVMPVLKVKQSGGIIFGKARAYGIGLPKPMLFLRTDRQPAEGDLCVLKS